MALNHHGRRAWTSAFRLLEETREIVQQLEELVQDLVATSDDLKRREASLEANISELRECAEYYARAAGGS